MDLTCECYPNEYDWMFMTPDDYTTLEKETTCSSCGETMVPGETVSIFELVMYDENGDEEEDEVYGGEVYGHPPLVMCEVCSDLFFSLRALGFCIAPDENMKHLVKEYAAVRARGDAFGKDYYG